MPRSTARTLTRNDFKSIAINTAIVAAAAAVSYLPSQLADADLGIWTPIITVGLAAAGKALDRFLRDTK